MKYKLFVSGFVISLWILVSPWVLGFSGLDVAKWNNVMAGLGLGLVWLWIYFGEFKR